MATFSQQTWTVELDYPTFGLRFATLHGLRSDGREITASLIEDEVAAMRGTETQAVIDAIPEERITAWKFSP